MTHQGAQPKTAKESSFSDVLNMLDLVVLCVAGFYAMVVTKNIPYSSTVAVEHSRRTRIALALQVATVISGGGYAMYQRVFGQCLGMHIGSCSSFAGIIYLLHPHVEEMLMDQIDLALQDMASMDQQKIGSKANAVNSADGCWLTRGAFSKKTVRFMFETFAPMR